LTVILTGDGGGGYGMTGGAREVVEVTVDGADTTGIVTWLAMIALLSATKPSKQQQATIPTASY